MTAPRSAPNEGASEPAFDPATWTPDKPWPKGYYKPVPGLVAAIERVDRASGADDGSSPGFRGFFWGLVSLPSQLLGLGFLAASHDTYGLMHAIVRHMTAWPPLLFFTLILPTWLHVGLVAPPGAPFGRTALSGLLRSLVLMAGLLLAGLLLFLRYRA